MKIVIFGLTISSSWGNGHATLWRGLCRALIARGHHLVFFERNVPYYAEHRDLRELPGGLLMLYPDWASVAASARREVADADVVITTSYCPDALEATELMWQSPALRVFYDLDTPVTMARLEAGENVEYLGAGLLGSYDLVLSYTGGRALAELRTRLGARRVAPLYGSVDPAEHCPAKPSAEFRCDLSYIGTYAADRQAALTALFVEPARRLPSQRFALAGAQYPPEFPWASNIFFVRHLAPSQHGAFFSSCHLTLNVTRSSMAAMGYCPSGRLFEAAACGAPLLSDAWPGLDEFFTPGEEIVLARSTDDAIAALSMGDQELQRIARAARERVLAEHTARHRAMELESLLETARLPVPA